jgi:hypothetical protein
LVSFRRAALAGKGSSSTIGGSYRGRRRSAADQVRPFAILRSLDAADLVLQTVVILTFYENKCCFLPGCILPKEVGIHGAGCSLQTFIPLGVFLRL